MSAAASAATVAEAVARLRTRKLPNPAVIGNAGSFFKNPIVPAAPAEERKAGHAAPPVRPARAQRRGGRAGDLGAGRAARPVCPAGDEAMRKLSAAWLIEQAGWKGHREGDAGIS